MSTCDQSLDTLLNDLHNSCSMSNIVYVVAGLFGVLALPGWWRLLGVAVIVEAVISFINHSNMNVGGISSTTWNYMDVSFAVTGCIVMIALVSIKHDKIPKRNIFICAAVFLTAILFFAFATYEAHGLSREERKKDPIKTFGIGNPLADEKITPDYDSERHQALYLSYHTAWHIVSGMAILVMLIVLTPALQANQIINKN